MPSMRETRRLSSDSYAARDFMKSQANRLFSSSDNELTATQQVGNRLLSSSDSESPMKLGHVNRLLSSDSELQLKGHVNMLLAGSDGHIQMKSRNHMMSAMKVGSKADGFERKGQAWFVATELQSDLVVEVGDMTFNLHKFPLLSRSGRLNRLAFESRDTEKDHIRLNDIPGGPDAFELAAKFCYGVAVDLTSNCIAALRCAAEYLEMTEDLEDGNLISKTEAFLSFVVLASWKDSITVLQSCESLSPWAENLQIVRRCTESIAWKACTDPRGISWSFTGRGGSSEVHGSNNNRNHHAMFSKSHHPENAGGDHVNPMWKGFRHADHQKKIVPQDWWIEDVSSLTVQYFVRVITAIRSKGMRSDLVGAAVVQYALKWIPGLDMKDSISCIIEPAADVAGLVTHDDGQPAHDHSCLDDHKDTVTNSQSKSRLMLESLVEVLPTQKDSLTCSFLLRMLRIANMLNASVTCRKELERRVGMQLDEATLPELLIPSFKHQNETLFDVELVQRVVESFLMAQDGQYQQRSPNLLNVNTMFGYNNVGGAAGTTGAAPASCSNSQNYAKMKVAKLMDSYLAEVARDANLSVAKFQALAEQLPECARACDDGLYRAIDTYLKAHSATSEVDRKRLCRQMDCQKLSLDACMHAAQNERLPLRVVVQVLFCEQVKLRNAITGSALSHRPALPHPQPATAAFYDCDPDRATSDNGQDTASATNSPWSAARHDIRLLKLDVENMKSKYAELQSDYLALQRQLEGYKQPANGVPARTGCTPVVPPPDAPLLSGANRRMSGLKKLARAPGHLFSKNNNNNIMKQQQTQNPSRFSIDDSSAHDSQVGGGGALPSTHLSKPWRRWRNSIS